MKSHHSEAYGPGTDQSAENTELFQYAAQQQKHREDAEAKAGRTARDGGMQRSLDNANSVDDSWGIRALNCVAAYPHDDMTCEDVRRWGEENNRVGPAPTARAWGAIMVRALRVGMIVKKDEYPTHRPSRNPKSHRRPQQIWLRVKPAESGVTP